MEFFCSGQRIEIVAVYDWFDVYVNNTMVLKHISEKDVNDIICAIEQSERSKNGERNEKVH